jgi:pimeloyl-CoA dehydrogenase small subunit
MDFDLSNEQSLLKDSVDRWAAATYGALGQIEAGRRGPLGFSEAVWRQFADLGLLALTFSEADGGFGGGPIETMVVMEALGRGLAPEPYLASVVLGSAAIQLAANAAQRETLIPSLIDGSLRLAFAHGERQARYDLHDVATSAQRTADGYVLDGHKSVVLNADAAGVLIISARTAGERRDTRGISLFIVPADAPGVSVQSSPSHDGGRSAEVILNGVTVLPEALLGPENGALDVISTVVAGAIAAVFAEAVGIMEALNALTVNYLKTRKQFGAAIGSFQSLQHRAADMLVALEQARSMELYAAMMVETQDPAERDLALSAAKVQLNRSARFVAQQAVQLHGGIGMTMDYLGAHYFRRLTLIEAQFGDTAHHLRAVARTNGLIKAS